MKKKQAGESIEFAFTAELFNLSPQDQPQAQPLRPGTRRPLLPPSPSTPPGPAPRPSPPPSHASTA